MVILVMQKHTFSKQTELMVLMVIMCRSGQSASNFITYAFTHAPHPLRNFTSAPHTTLPYAAMACGAYSTWAADTYG